MLPTLLLPTLLSPAALAAPGDGTPTLDTTPPVSVHALALPDLAGLLTPEECCAVRLHVRPDKVVPRLKACPEHAHAAVRAALGASQLTTEDLHADVWLQLAVTESGETRGAVLHGADTGGLPFEGWATVQTATIRHTLRVRYPLEAGERRQRAHRCVVHIELDAAGRPTGSRATRCEEPYYQAVQEALPTFRFEPLRVDGQARRSEFKLSTSFVPRGNRSAPERGAEHRQCRALVR